jgi:hypothetical protein
MKVIDARTGTELAVGTPVIYGDGEGVTLLSVEPGLLSARARIRSTYRDHANRLVTSETWCPLAVRWTHPRYFLQHVAFLPS